MKRFQDKVVFITGSATGIGRECAIQFSQQGAKVAISDVNLTGLEQTKEDILGNGGNVKSYQLDVSQYQQVRSVIEKVESDFGTIDIAVNNAGIGAKNNLRTAEHTLEDWDRVIAVNQSGVFYCMKEELAVMQEHSTGSIVNISSIAGMRALAKQNAYVASKHAVIGMTKTAAAEYARKGIRVNAVCPVFTNSPLLEQMFSQREDLRAKLVHTIPVGRYGETSDIVNAITWLCDEQSSFITGLALPVDGGQTA